MIVRGPIASGLVLLALAHSAGGQPLRPPPADFKLVVALHDERALPIETAELVVNRGRVHQFTSTSSEVLIVDTVAGRIDLLDLKHQVQTSVTFRKLDKALATLHRELSGSVGRFEQKGDRASRLTARMTRDLIDPDLSATFDKTSGRLRLIGATAEVEGTGLPEPDSLRMSLIADVLPALAKLESMRDREDIPPFTRLAAFKALSDDHHLRPSEISCLYRLMGKPVRIRWTYRLVDSLTDREREALARIDALRGRAVAIDFDRYSRLNPRRLGADQGRPRDPPQPSP